MNSEIQTKKDIVQNGEISLKDLLIQAKQWLDYLKSKWLIIFVVGIIGAIGGFFYAKTRKPIYTATTTFVLEDEKSSVGMGSLAGLASMAGVDIENGGGIFQGENIIELYKSRKMVTQTLLSSAEIDGERTLLIDRYIDFNGLRKDWTEKPNLSSLSFATDSKNGSYEYTKDSRLRDSVMRDIVADISKNYLSVAKLDKKLSVIKVDVKAKDEIFAKTFNDAIVKNVNDFFLQTKTKKSMQNVRIMQNKTDSVRSVMNGAIYSAVAVADATPNLNPTRQVQRIAPAQKAQFSAETNKAILSSMVQNLELSKLNLMKETPLLEVIDQPIYPLSMEKLGKVKALVLGGLIFIIVTVIFLLLRKILSTILT